MPVTRSLSFTSHTIAYSPSFQSVFNAALDVYTKHTGNELTNHPLSIKVESRNIPGDVLCVLQEQAKVFREFREGNQKMMGHRADGEQSCVRSREYFPIMLAW